MTTHAIQITQEELQEVFELEREIAGKQRRVDELKANIKILLIGKAPIQMGRFFARLVTMTVRHVSWKQVVIDELGIEFAEAIRKNSSSSVLSKVVVDEHGSLPLWKHTIQIL
jgi:hypothetical protein